MSEQIIEEVQETIPTDALPEQSVLPEEQSFTYQPTDESGRPIGGLQVIKYRTQEDLNKFWQEQNTLLIRKLRSETKKNRLGISDEADVPTDAQQFEKQIDFTPRQLSADERVMLSRDLLDPERFNEATNTLFESTVGASPSVISKTLTELQASNTRLMAKVEADAFVESNPDYVKCEENFQAITNWMVRYNLAPIQENFQKAYEKLRADGILVERQEKYVPEPTPVVEEAEKSAVTKEPETPAQPVTRIPTGFTRRQAGDAGTPRQAGDDIVYELFLKDGKGNLTGEKKVYKGMAAIDAMPSDEYKDRLKHDPTFSTKVEKLFNQQKKK